MYYFALNSLIHFNYYKMNKLTSITLLIISFLAVTQFSQAQCNIDDWDALKALYDNTNGQNWTNRTGWDMLISGQTIPPNNCDLNTLYGVATEDGRVTCIDLDGKVDCVHSYNDGNNLDGTIPTELEKLSDLKQLVLANNKLEGSIPTELGNLTNLTIFNLHKNELTGSIPPELGNLTNLKFLALSENGFDGSIPVELYSLKTLKELYLKKNGLTGTISPEINNLTKMENLQLWSNALTGNLPVELCDLTNLNTLQIHHNDFTGCYPDCFNQFCGIASNFDIGYENEFDAEWEDFCTNNDQTCVPNSTDSYDQSEAINFTHYHSTQTLHIASSNLPIENITLYNNSGQFLRNYQLSTFNNTKISLTGLPTGLCVVVATVKGKLYKANYYKITI